MMGVMKGLYGGLFTPTEAGVGGAFIALVIAVAQGRIGPRGFFLALTDAMSTTAQIVFNGMGAILFTRLPGLAGIGSYLTGLAGDWAVDPILLVVALSLVFEILGMVLDPPGIMLITIPVFLPMFKAPGLDVV
jgi:TRAP-type C4-dicarboxylate transport system permease large subunit